MSRRLLIVWLIALLPTALHAQYHAAEFVVQGGGSMMLYRGLTDGAHQVLGASFGAHIGYAYYFVPYFGLGTGIDIHRYGGGIRRTYSETQYDVYDTDGEICDITTTYTNWTNRQQLYYLELPLSLNFRIPLEEVEILLNVGAKYNFFLSGSQWAKGQVTYVGYYDKWHLTLADIAPHDFYTKSDGEAATPLTAKNTAAVFARLDVAIPISKQWSVLVGAYGEYALQSVMAIDRTDGTAHPTAFGIEAGIRYLIKQKPHHKCNCYRY